MPKTARSEAPKVPSQDAKDVKGVRNGERVSPLRLTKEVWGSVVNSTVWFGAVPPENGFQCFPSITKCFLLRCLL